MPNILLIQNTYPDRSALRNVINYVLKSDIVEGYAVDPYDAFRQMTLIKSVFHKQDGEQLIHFVITFSNLEMYRLTLDEVLALGFQVGNLFQEYQMLYGIHTETTHVHLHIIMNPVSFIDGHRYSNGLAGFWRLKKMLKQQFPRSEVGIYYSFPNSDCNRYTHTKEDELLRIGQVSN